MPFFMPLIVIIIIAINIEQSESIY